MNTDYIKSLLNIFKNKSIYEIETALAIYEFIDKDVKEVSEDEILEVYYLIHSQDEIFADYIKEEVIRIKESFSKEKKELEDIEK